MASINLVRTYGAPPETVFDAWLDAEVARQFLFATQHGVMERVEITPRAGGRFVVSERRGEVLAVHEGTYLAIERPHRLAFDLAAAGAAPTRVTVSIASAPEGCSLSLVHEGVWAGYEEPTRVGWKNILDQLAAAFGVR